MTTTQLQQDGDPEHVTEIEQLKYACAANNALWRNQFFLKKIELTWSTPNRERG